MRYSKRKRVNKRQDGESGYLILFLCSTDCINDKIDVLLTEAIMNRKRQDIFCQVLGDGQIAFAVEFFENRLLVKPPGVMHAGGDPLFFQVFGQSVAAVA